MVEGTNFLLFLGCVQFTVWPFLILWFSPKHLLCYLLTSFSIPWLILQQKHLKTVSVFYIFLYLVFCMVLLLFLAWKQNKRDGTPFKYFRIFTLQMIASICMVCGAKIGCMKQYYTEVPLSHYFELSSWDHIYYGHSFISGVETACSLLCLVLEFGIYLAALIAVFNFFNHFGYYWDIFVEIEDDLFTLALIMLYFYFYYN